ncbi:hypothetical protein SAMN06272735_7675 [Streptomyces sp. TLI_55]|nr:hypothetical protein SAMN06272735_7675 [Streptomyces sp. TLI_55]
MRHDTPAAHPGGRDGRGWGGGVPGVFGRRGVVGDWGAFGIPRRPGTGARAARPGGGGRKRGRPVRADGVDADSAARGTFGRKARTRAVARSGGGGTGAGAGVARLGGRGRKRGRPFRADGVDAGGGARGTFGRKVWTRAVACDALGRRGTGAGAGVARSGGRGRKRGRPFRADGVDAGGGVRRVRGTGSGARVVRPDGRGRECARRLRVEGADEDRGAHGTPGGTRIGRTWHTRRDEDRAYLDGRGPRRPGTPGRTRTAATWHTTTDEDRGMPGLYGRTAGRRPERARRAWKGTPDQAPRRPVCAPDVRPTGPGGPRTPPRRSPGPAGRSRARASGWSRTRPPSGPRDRP